MLQHIVAPVLPVPLVGARSRPTGLTAGTLIRTDEGDYPVEYLLAGDMIETVNNGLVELRGTSLVEAREIDVVQFSSGYTDSRGHPLRRDLVVPINQQVLVNDWRAQILHGQDTMLTPASSLVDDLRITRQKRDRLRLIRLHFDIPQVIWADGMEVASARTNAPTVRDASKLH